MGIAYATTTGKGNYLFYGPGVHWIFNPFMSVSWSNKSIASEIITHGASSWCRRRAPRMLLVLLAWHQAQQHCVPWLLRCACCGAGVSGRAKAQRVLFCLVGSVYQWARFSASFGVARGGVGLAGTRSDTVWHGDANANDSTGDKTIVTILQGHVGYCEDRGQPVLLPPGLHEWRSPTLRFIRTVDLNNTLVRLGPYTVLTVDEGYSAITQNNGESCI